VWLTAVVLLDVGVGNACKEARNVWSYLLPANLNQNLSGTLCGLHIVDITILNRQK
jgi:hypothetical protein